MDDFLKMATFRNKTKRKAEMHNLYNVLPFSRDVKGYVRKQDENETVKTWDPGILL